MQQQRKNPTLLPGDSLSNKHKAVGYGTPGKSRELTEVSSANTNTRHELSGLRDLFEDQLKGIYWSEKTLTTALPKMIKQSTSGDLTEALKQQLDIREQHVARCEEVFSSLSLFPEAKKNEAMQGLVKEANSIIGAASPGGVRDAGIISAVQKVEHYEIASYGTLAAFARQLGENKAVSLLEEMLAEEKVADALLSEVAEKSVNKAAVTMPGRDSDYSPET